MTLLNDPNYHVTLRGKRVLVVEDEALVAMLVEDSLLEAGAKVVGTASTVGEALLLIEGAASDGGLNVAVLDVKLAGETVSPVADRLATLGVPFLFATGYGEGCDRGVHADAPVLAKPFDPEVLLTAVEGLAAGDDAAHRARQLKTDTSVVESSFSSGAVHTSLLPSLRR